MKLTYFNLWAKGPASGLALMHSGLHWEGVNPAAWKEMKPTTPFGELPVLEVEGLGMIGHEAAILNYIERANPAKLSDRDFAVSQQLLSEGEDMYQKLVKFQDTLYAKDKCSKAENDALWSAVDCTVHNRAQGMRVHLLHLERLAAGGAAGAYTAAGFSVGECKLFASLHAIKLIKPDILSEFPAVLAFYNRFHDDAKTQAFILHGGDERGKFPAAPVQYFV
ncbi:hypothetical protein M885DRAFT_525614 [Pelagophyceae sp. CCMP2097]|nr:hypothetical protein M885DRAFT_525614 [Pelagophyceae sp. CCMP2097]|mmetsp:Transcript_101/g.414  ORF Transcript_101/g.414 Transcript_101/m.414 type:complete len:222 (+) Transcript_101:105-770(+)